MNELNFRWEQGFKHRVAKLFVKRQVILRFAAEY